MLTWSVTVYLPAHRCRHRVTLGSLGFRGRLVAVDHKRLGFTWASLGRLSWVRAGFYYGPHLTEGDA
jgi:hypothetical protein